MPSRPPFEVGSIGGRRRRVTCLCYPAGVRTSDFDYALPADRIAQTPVEPRDDARLLVVDRAGGELEHRRFFELDRLLDPGDLLVANDSRVIPARLHGRKLETGGAVEALLLTRSAPGLWQALVKGRVHEGTRLAFDPPPAAVGVGTATAAGGGDAGVITPVEAVVEELLTDGRRLLRFERPVSPLLEVLGAVPLPPYITAPLDDPERYQTVYSRVAGSVAAPTAGLHFTPDLLQRMEERGIGLAFVTLHVGLDTFRPVTAEDVAEHHMHSEWASVPVETAAAVTAARRAGRRVVAVGTTSVRALEAAAHAVGRSDVPQPAGGADVSVVGTGPWSPGDKLAPFEGWTALFITPGYAFGAVTAMVTNFHLPRTTLLMLVAAFAGKATMDDAYAAAIRGPYRFYSFGDAMLIR